MTWVMLTYIIAIGGIVVGCFVSGGRANAATGLALLISLIVALYATAEGNPVLLALSLPLCAAIAFLGWTTACLAIASLYAVRLLFLSAAVAGFMEEQTFWNWNEGWLLLQMLIAVGGIVSPALADRLSPSTFWGNIIHRYNFVMARRL